jgi:hypothetical protein
MRMILVRIRIQVQREVLIWIRMRMQIILDCKECIKIALKRGILDSLSDQHAYICGSESRRQIQYIADPDLNKLNVKLNAPFS